MSALELAARSAEDEAEGLRGEAVRLRALIDVCDASACAFTDAVNAYVRARDRATSARLLAEHHAGGYNVWESA